MAPEQLRHEKASPKVDIYAAAVVSWEVLTGKRLFDAADEASVVAAILLGDAVPPPSRVLKEPTHALDAVILRGLERDPAKRFASANEMALELEKCVTPATAVELAAWVESRAGSLLADRATTVAKIERTSALASAAVPSSSDEATDLRHDVVPPKRVEAIEAAADEVALRARSWRWAVAALALLVAIVVASVIRYPRVRDERSVPTAGAAVAPVHSATAVATAPLVSAPATAAPSPLQSAATPRRVQPSSADVARPSRSADRRLDHADCTPPYVWDAQGVKHYKPDCM
jgi:serine/threonine-protein kinase